MAGLGTKLFIDGEILDAAEVNGYLQDQVIMRFANAATRDAAFGGVGEPTLAEGMTCYLNDLNVLQSYNGSAWVSVAASQTTANVSSGLVFIKSQTIGAAVTAQVVSNAFSATYDNYVINVSGGTNSVNANLDFKFGTTVAGYRFNFVYGSYTSGTPTVSGTTAGGNIPFVGFANVGGLMMSATVLSPFLACPSAIFSDGGSLGAFTGRVQGFEPSNTSFADFTVSAGSGTMTGGNITVYGYQKG